MLFASPWSGTQDPVGFICGLRLAVSGEYNRIRPESIEEERILQAAFEAFHQPSCRILFFRDLPEEAKRYLGSVDRRCGNMWGELGQPCLTARAAVMSALFIFEKGVESGDFPPALDPKLSDSEFWAILEMSYADGTGFAETLAVINA